MVLCLNYKMKSLDVGKLYLIQIPLLVILTVTLPPGDGLDQNTPGTAGGPGGRDRTLAVKIARKSAFFVNK